MFEFFCDFPFIISTARFLQPRSTETKEKMYAKLRDSEKKRHFKGISVERSFKNRAELIPCFGIYFRKIYNCALPKLRKALG